METPTPPLAVAKPMEPPSTAPQPAEAKPKKRSSVRHTRAIQRDRSKRPLSAPPAEAVVARLTEIVHPATLAQVGYFHGLGLRARILTLPVMVALAAAQRRQPSLCLNRFERILAGGRNLLVVVHQAGECR